MIARALIAGAALVGFVVTILAAAAVANALAALITGRQP